MRRLSRLFAVGGAHRRHLGAVLLGCLVSFGFAAACADTDRRVPSVSINAGAGGPGIPDRCATPNEGCECDVEGTELDCGRLRETFEDYVTCQMGTRTCEDGQWGACSGDRLTVKSTSAGGGLRPQGLGSSVVCGNDAGTDVDPCDPYCNITPDTPGGFDAGVTFVNTDAGLTLTGVADAGVACTTLTLTPSTTTATVTAFSPVTTSPAAPVTFTLTPGPAGCTFTAPFLTTWAINKVERATITGTNNTNGTLTLNVPIAGPISITAYALGMSATTTVTFKVNVVEAPITDALAAPNDSAATSSPYTAINAFSTVANACAPAVLDGCRNSPNVPATASSATWLYPQDGTYFPLGLLAPWVQYLYGATTTPGVVKVSLRYPTGLTATAATTLFNYSLIVEETNGAARNFAGVAANTLDPQVVLPQTAWQYFEQTARGQNADLLIQRRRGNGTLETEIRRVVRLVDGQLKGTVFYSSYNSALAGNTGAVLRIAPGAATPTVAVQPNSTSAAGGTRRCTVCHTVNDSGTRLIVNGGRPTGSITFNQSRRYDVTNPATQPYAVPVINAYDNSTGSDTEYNIAGDRFTYGAPFLDGTLYMTHGGRIDSGYQGDRNWRAPDDYSRLYRLLTTPVAGANTTALTVTNWTNISAVTPHFSHDGTKLAFGFWGSSTVTLPCSTSAVSPCTGSPRRLSPVAAGTRLVVADFSCSSPPCTGASSNFTVTNARDVTNGITHRVAWPAFTPTGNGVFYQRQYRTSMSSANGGVVSSPWSPSPLNSVTGALAEIWLSNIPADGNTLAVPTQLRALNGLNAAGTATLLPTASRLAAPAQNTYHATNGSFTINVPDNCSVSGTATGVNDYQLNYLPSVAPTQAGGLTWVVFTSRRMFGNIAYNDPWDAAPGETCNSGVPPAKKLWVAAVDATWTPGTDPSHPAFYLPGQELAAANADADWVSSPCGNLNATCASHDDCCLATGAGATRECRITGTMPLARTCQTISACAAIGAACTVPADCCTGTCPTNGGVCFVQPPPVVPTYTQSTTAREYIANCPAATHVKWRLFEWQATVPAGTSIEFRVQTKQNAADNYSPTDAAAALMSTAMPATGTGPGVWYRGGSTADQILAALSPALPSRNYLRVSMTFKPTSSAAPTLHQWRQIYDCLPSE